ncbi:MAG: L-serine ammonia-lyase, iron-sulfur-dependent, subunit alpha [Eubacteriales bacterium]
MKIASIFNDVIGPVMRGSSSSHVAAAVRIGTIVRDMAEKDLKTIKVKFDTNGSLATSYDGHGTDSGLVCGMLGYDLTDERVLDVFNNPKTDFLDIEFIIGDYGQEHPNYMNIEVECSNGRCFSTEAISTGGGMIEILSYNKNPLSMLGDYYEMFLTMDKKSATAELTVIKDIVAKWEASYHVEEVVVHSSQEVDVIVVKSLREFPTEIVEELENVAGVTHHFLVDPVLLTLANKDGKVPFTCASELLEYAKDNDKEMWEMGLLYESIRSGRTEEEIFAQMDYILKIMQGSVEQGLSGTQYRDRILGEQAKLIKKNKKKLIKDQLITGVIESITSIMEVKSSLGVIVAAPTAGSCGCLPGTVIGLGKYLEATQEEMIQGMLAAGLVGVFFAQNATFAAEVAGCQVECGAGSGMAAAAVAQMLGGDVRECVDASSVALQNITGLVCDPVGNRVEVPCLGKNVMGGVNAIASANMILAGYDKVIPLDETIAAILDIGKKLPLELRCTYGGLGKTPTSDFIYEELKKNNEL